MNRCQERSERGRFIALTTRDVVDGDLHENGKLVSGESIADLGGLTIAYAAYEKSLEGKPRPPEKDGFTAEQRFFLGWAQIWGANERLEYARLLAKQVAAVTFIFQRVASKRTGIRVTIQR